ncbi:hypothetical protein [Carboxylicivirga taeanensis]|uniref:hypothetical protein n=1 Tax=Carboxylicivirga taeanensis TaxID=1416875 RepID=UPI003F6DFE44
MDTKSLINKIFFIDNFAFLKAKFWLSTLIALLFIDVFIIKQFGTALPRLNEIKLEEAFSFLMFYDIVSFIFYFFVFILSVKFVHLVLRIFLVTLTKKLHWHSSRKDLSQKHLISKNRLEEFALINNNEQLLGLCQIFQSKKKESDELYTAYFTCIVLAIMSLHYEGWFSNISPIINNYNWIFYSIGVVSLVNISYSAAVNIDDTDICIGENLKMEVEEYFTNRRNSLSDLS